jgi:hypothetical protein
MRTDANATTRESLASKRFRASTNREQPQLEFSGFGFESLAAHKAQVTQVSWAPSCPVRTLYALISSLG